MRIFLDANVLFSAAKSKGAVRELLTRLQLAGHRLCVDSFVVEEARRNLERKGPDALLELERLLPRLEIGVASGASYPEVDEVLPEKDRPVLAAAVRMRCRALVTGDRTHFGRLYATDILGVTIHSPRSLAETMFR